MIYGYVKWRAPHTLFWPFCVADNSRMFSNPKLCWDIWRWHEFCLEGELPEFSKQLWRDCTEFQQQLGEEWWHSGWEPPGITRRAWQVLCASLARPPGAREVSAVGFRASLKACCTVHESIFSAFLRLPLARNSVTECWDQRQSP